MLVAYHIWKDERSICQGHHFVRGKLQNIALKDGIRKPNFRNFAWRGFSKYQGSSSKWLQKQSFDAEYTIILLPTDDQHVKDGFCGKNW